jgi:uncharacterized protein (TIGR03084 family)
MAQQDVFATLKADGDEVDDLVAHLDDAGWRTPTPAAGWTVTHQVAHLSATFRMAATAAAAPDDFRAMMAGMTGTFESSVEAAMVPYLALPPVRLLGAFRDERAAAEKATSSVPDGELVPWLVRPIPGPVLATAGMMELFGHGQDIADALRVRRTRTDRLRHLVEFGVRTWDFGYQARGLTPPPAPFRFVITAPSGARWEFGPQEAVQTITGPAEDFCLLVTRRRHRDDLAMTATGPDADRWLDIAQAYRGPAGPGRRPGQFAR